jgi:hypothetical protein
MDPNVFAQELRALMRSPRGEAVPPSSAADVLGLIALTPRGWARYQHTLQSTMRRAGLAEVIVTLEAELLDNGDLAIHRASSVAIESVRFPCDEWHWRRPPS